MRGWNIQGVGFLLVFLLIAAFFLFIHYDLYVALSSGTHPAFGPRFDRDVSAFRFWQYTAIEIYIIAFSWFIILGVGWLYFITRKAKGRIGLRSPEFMRSRPVPQPVVRSAAELGLPQRFEGNEADERD